MKVIYEIIIIILFNIFIISLNNVNFSAIFIVSTTWIIYLNFFLRRVAKIKNKKWLSVLSKIYGFLVFIFIISFIIIEGLLIFNISQFKEAKDIEKMDYVLVLGAGLDGEKVGNVLKSRLDQAIKYYKLNNKTNIIVSGGQGKDEIISEAEAMYRYLIENGVNPNQIIKEDKATTTLENIKFSKEILKNRGDEDKKVLIVTNEFHLYRAMIIGDMLGIKNEGLASQTPIKIRINYMIREYTTIIIDVLRTSIYKIKSC